MSDSDRNAVPRAVWIGLALLLLATVIGELFVAHKAKFGIDGSFAFYGWYTAVCAVAGVLLAWLLGALLKTEAASDDD